MPRYNYADVIDTINEQLQETSIELCDSLCNIITNTVYKKIFVAAVGRSKMVANMFAMRLMHLGYDVRVVGETITPSIRAGNILFVVSGSGETGQLIGFVNKAKDAGAKVILVTETFSSTLQNLSDNVFIIGDKTIHNSLPLGSRFELSALIFLETAILRLMHIDMWSEENMKNMHANLE
jgi:6-phospho-3-hexuloisomerase